VVIPNGTGSVVNTATVSASQNDPNTSNNAATVIVQVNGQTTNPNPDPDPNPDNPGADSDGSNNSGCSSSLAGAANNKDTAFNLGLLLLPFFIIGLRAVRRRQSTD